MLKTLTGGFPIGIRRGYSEYHKDLAGLIAWCMENEVGVLDLGGDADHTARQVLDSGLAIGSVDLVQWQAMLSENESERKAGVAMAREYVERVCSVTGPMRFFTVMMPQDPTLPRQQVFGYMVESYNELAKTFEKTGSHAVVEGWPGPGVTLCTPETLRVFFKECPSSSLGLNYDPSHLIRMGIDPIRFLSEFANRVYHVHGKDCEMMSERVYELGFELPATFMSGFGFGGYIWRYTIPGYGEMRWRRAFQILSENGYQGAVSIELEDESFHDTEALQKLGYIKGLQFLSGC